MVEKIKKAYFTKDCNNLIRKFQSLRLGYSADGTLAWLADHTAPSEKLKELLVALAGEMLIKPISDMKVHVKLESLAKLEPPLN